MAPLYRGINLFTRVIGKAPEAQMITQALRRHCSTETAAKKGWWSSAEFWGGAGALAGWGMTGGS